MHTQEKGDTMNAKHTPTPWQAEGYRVIKQMREEPYEADLIIASTGNSTTEAIENAAFIVRACNAHEELLEALKDFETAVQMARDGKGLAHDHNAINAICDASKKAKEAIAKAEGRS